MKPGDWLAYSADENEARVRELAAAKLGVSEDEIEVQRTSGCWLARVRREETE